MRISFCTAGMCRRCGICLTIQKKQCGNEANMYFEPSKKNYYRFPSYGSIKELDQKFYFPDKPYANGESTRMTSKEEPDNIYSDNYHSSK